MKKYSTYLVLAALMTFGLPSAWAQLLGKVRGKVTEGPAPIAGAVVELTNPETGRKYDFTTNDKGEFFSIGVAIGKYNVVVTKGKEVLTSASNFPVTAGDKDNELDLDVAADRTRAMQKISEEERRKREQITKENEKIGSINAMLSQASEMQKAGNYDGAVDVMKRAVEADSTKGIVLARLGDAELLAARKTSNRADSQEKAKAALDAFNRALQAPATGPGALKPEDQAIVNLNSGEAYARVGNDQEALAACQRAAAVPGPYAGTCYFNVGAVLTNAGKIDNANTAFDRAIAADPTRADAYYQKAVNLLGKATVDKDGKMKAPPEVETNLNKYLELQPTGPNAQAAKELLASLGAKIQTSYGSKSATGKKK